MDKIFLPDNLIDMVSKHREFLEKMYALCEEYECSIEYHPEVGMIVLDKMNSYER